VGEQIKNFIFNDSLPQRLDKFLVSCMPDYSRSRIQALIKQGKVIVNGHLALKTGQILDKRSTILITIPPPEPSNLIPELIPLEVIFENTDLIIVNKPAGMVVHPGAGHKSGTLVHAVLAHTPDIEGIGGELRPGVVHRLDKNTSGLIILAKNDYSHQWLARQFKERMARKKYLALVDGTPPTASGRIEAAIGRDPVKRKSMAITIPDKGRAAITEYQSLERFQNHTFLEIKPITGRTHQIRVHMAFIGCPVVGDTVYGKKQASVPIKRHFLHAASLTIVIPGEVESRTFNAPLPNELKQVLTSLVQSK
jgi:23S rRNA pseudouridine1911/1915/1917 synthase